MITIKLITHRTHCAQICTGFESLFSRKGIIYEDHYQDNEYPSHNFPIIQVEYNGQILMYDTEDGYFDEMHYYLSYCDFYFKRSFSDEKNRILLTEEEQRKIYPLGLNYEVFSKYNPYADFDKDVKQKIKCLFGKKSHKYFTSDKFEGQVQYKDCDLKIIFYTRLWEQDPRLSKEKNDERVYINNTRIEIIKRLKEEYGNLFIGGLFSNSLAQRIAPDLVLSRYDTEKFRYLKLLHNSDIAIGSMGLHESIGWKTAEYVAAGKAIVNESLHYDIPGSFEANVNYLEFQTVNQCIDAVKWLMDNPMETYKMKCMNLLYYNMYMKPEIMIRRTLDVVDSKLT